MDEQSSIWHIPTLFVIKFQQYLCNIHIFKEKTDKNLSLPVAILDFRCTSPLPQSHDLVRPDHDQNTSAHVHNICVLICQQHLCAHLQYICVKFCVIPLWILLFPVGTVWNHQKRTFTSSHYWISKTVTFYQEWHFPRVTFLGYLWFVYKIIGVMDLRLATV